MMQILLSVICRRAYLR